MIRRLWRGVADAPLTPASLTLMLIWTAVVSATMLHIVTWG